MADHTSRPPHLQEAECHPPAFIRGQLRDWEFQKRLRDAVAAEGHDPHKPGTQLLLGNVPATLLEGRDGPGAVSTAPGTRDQRQLVNWGVNKGRLPRNFPTPRRTDVVASGDADVDASGAGGGGGAGAALAPQVGRGAGSMLGSLSSARGRGGRRGGRGRGGSSHTLARRTQTESRAAQERADAMAAMYAELSTEVSSALDELRYVVAAHRGARACPHTHTHTHIHTHAERRLTVVVCAATGRT